MVGAADLDKLRRVIKSTSKLLCVLDNYQLSPVDGGDGCGLNDLPAMQIAPPIYLTEKVRQAEGSMTADAADAIRALIDDGKRVHIEHLDMLPTTRAADADEVGKWLAAAARDDVDAKAIGFTNDVCFRVAASAERALHEDDKRWHIGSDVVMLNEFRRRKSDGRYEIARNNATGYVVHVADAADMAQTPHGEFFVDVITVDFDGKRIELPVVAGDSGEAFKFFRGIGSKIGALRASKAAGAKDELARLRSTYRVLKSMAWCRLAWASTAHRMQGSECDRPLILWRDVEQIVRIHKTAGVLEHARALYVAVTRATRDGGAVIVTGV